MADYAAALARYLSVHCRLRLNDDGDVNLYHIGNNSLHGAIYKRALSRPGIVVLHDAVLHHFMLGALTRDEYLNEFTYNYGAWTQTRAEQLWQDRGRSAADPAYFSYALLKRLAEASTAVIVHNPAAARIVREHHSSAKVVEIPHLLIPHDPPHLAVSERLRSKWGPGPAYGVFGHLRESKRILPLLRLFARRRDCKLVLAGDIASRDLLRACQPYLSFPNIIRLPGFMTERDYWIAGGAVDACINLRHPAAGETSGVAIGMMGIGTPVILSNLQENSRYPAATCVKITPGLLEEPELEDVIDWAAQRRSQLREIGAAGASYVRSAHNARKVAEQFALVLTKG